MGTSDTCLPSRSAENPSTTAPTSSPSARSSTRCSPGSRAFHRSTSAETMTAILNEDPPSISLVAQSTPPGLQRVIHRCLEKNPSSAFNPQPIWPLLWGLCRIPEAPLRCCLILEGAHVGMGSSGRSRGCARRGRHRVVAIPPAVPVVESVTQLTDDGEPKPGHIGIYTDGSRIYFNEGSIGSRRIAEVSVNGGPTALVDSKLDSPQILGLAADGSEMLAAPDSTESFASPLWSIPLPAGEPRRIRAIEAAGAAYLPDGRIVFTSGKGVFVADRDGANQRQLASVTLAYMPSVSPDGQTISIAMGQNGAGFPSLVEVAANGTGFRTAYPAVNGGGVWSSDGRYLLYPDSSSDIWALPVRTGLFHRSSNRHGSRQGRSYIRPCARAAMGTALCPCHQAARRAGALRFEITPVLALSLGISAVEPTFSEDGKWVAYASYPDGNLWRSRSDGSDKLRLTYPPMKANNPRISADGTKVAFYSDDYRTFVVDMSGALPPQIVAKGDNLWVPTWSPDGNLLVVGSAKEGAPFGDRTRSG